jgi:hypothetical protein
MRILFALLFCLATVAARAASPAYPCPSFVAGWALSGPGPITSISWDSISQQMYFVWTNTPVIETLYCPLENENKTTLLVTEGAPISLRSENPACTATLLYNIVSDYYPVPNSSTMQAFSQSKNWVQTFNYTIAPSYHAVLLKEKDNCPVFQENFSFVCNLEIENGYQPLATETNAVLFTENPTCSTMPGSFVWVN